MAREFALCAPNTLTALPIVVYTAARVVNLRLVVP